VGEPGREGGWRREEEKRREIEAPVENGPALLRTK